MTYIKRHIHDLIIGHLLDVVMIRVGRGVINQVNDISVDEPRKQIRNEFRDFIAGGVLSLELDDEES